MCYAIPFHKHYSKTTCRCITRKRYAIINSEIVSMIVGQQLGNLIFIHKCSQSPLPVERMLFIGFVKLWIIAGFNAK